MIARNTLALLVTLATASMPGIASASSGWHPAWGEEASTFHPDHLTAQRSRAEVLAELDAARRDGTLGLASRGLALPQRADGPARSRMEVIAELRRESPEQRRIRQNAYRVE